jgi:transcriptional/translational regulatory protein YebC/TACO1
LSTRGLNSRVFFRTGEKRSRASTGNYLEAVASLRNAGVTTDGQKFTFIPDTTVPVADETVARQILRLCDALEDDDDVQNVYSNLEIPDELLARVPA